MAEPTYNPSDPELLVSRGIDGDLSEDERRRLDEALGALPSLRGGAKALSAVDDHVRRWATEAPPVDADEYEQAVLARIAEAVDCDAPEPVDSIIGRWAGDVPRVNENAFVEGVLHRIAPNRVRAIRPPWIVRLGVPLAAAAAVIMAVTATMWRSAARVPVVTIAMGPTASIDEAAAPPVPRVVIAFGKREKTMNRTERERHPISFAAVGSAPIVASAGGMPPL